MRKVITFLGRRPMETDYEFNGKTYSGKVFAEAMRQFVAFDQMLVCATEEAHTDTWPVLEALQDERIIEVSIPRGETTQEMWEMFDRILVHIAEKDTVIFDITHGLRSLPFLVFLFAAYLKAARSATIEAIYYGAYELGDAQVKRPAPVIDLSEFVTLLDWLTATDQFTQAGDGRRLAKLLNPQGLKSGPAARAEKTLLTVSQAAFLCQPFTLMKTVGGLGSDLLTAESELDLTAHPFGVLRDQITATFRRFESDIAKDVREGLRAEYRLILWYYANKQHIQTVTLSREWLIDAVTYRLGQPLDLRSEPRTRMERAISGLERVGQKRRNEQTGEMETLTREDLNEYGRIIYDTWPERDTIIKLWTSLSPLRNALDHAEHQASPAKLATLIEKIEKVMPLLHDLAQQWDLAS